MTPIPRVMPQPQADVLLAIEQAKTELTKLVNDGLAGIQLAISHLQREHDQALLEQAKMNATFSTRSEHSSTADRIAIVETTLKAHEQRLLDSFSERNELRATCDDLGKRLASLQTRALQNQLSWLVSGIVAVAAAVAGYGIAHFVQ